jgi:6-phosphogluconolactonase
LSGSFVLTNGMKILRALLWGWLATGLVQGREQFVYFGTYTSGLSQGIYVSRFDTATGRLAAPVLAAETRNPSFLAVHPTGKVLYAVGEVNDAQGKRAGAINAFARDPKSGQLTLLNQESSGGTGPCHLAVDATGQCLLVANYSSGSIAALPLRADGRLETAATIIQHTGASVHPKRQTGPHAHFIQPSPDNRFALACDLGLDQVRIYQLDAARARLTAHLPAFAALAPGAGPRHFAFAPDARFVHVLNELNLTVTAFAYDTNAATLREGQTISTLPADYVATERDTAAQIVVHPSGRFVYASNRGHDSIAGFAVEPGTGTLTLIENVPTQGRTPRNFAVDPEGRWLLAANQNSNSVVGFAIDPATGRLRPTGQAITVGSPVCVVFVPVQ